MKDIIHASFRSLLGVALLLMLGCDKSNEAQDNATQNSTPQTQAKSTSSSPLEGSNRDVLIDRGISLKVIETDFIPSASADTDGRERIVLKLKIVGRTVPFALLKTKAYFGNELKTIVISSIQPKENTNGTVWQNQSFYPDRQGKFNIPNAFQSLAGNLSIDEEELIDLESGEGMIDRVEVSIQRPGEAFSKFVIRNIKLLTGRSK